MPTPDFLPSLRSLLDALPQRPFALRLPDGTEIPPDSTYTQPLFTLRFNNVRALRHLLLPISELALGEAYLYDDFDIEGDLVAAFAFIDDLDWRKLINGRTWHHWWRLWRQLPHRSPTSILSGEKFTAYNAVGTYHSTERDQRSARFHYDVSNEFYRLWLDQQMVYSCAYFNSPQEDLDTAQQRKLDLVCRKLNLKRDDTFLDIGCGWGGLVIHAAQHYGVQATGITLSLAQQAEAEARIQAAGLANRCRVIACHYEEFTTQQPFAKIASIGMFEHVGPDRFADYIGQVYNMLQPGGAFILQGASTRLDNSHMRQGWLNSVVDWLGYGRNAFYDKYFFPDSALLDIPTIISTAEKIGFEMQHVENLRHHYALTLYHWLKNLEAQKETAVLELGELAYRCWRLLSAYTYYFMDKGLLTEYQTLFTRHT
ncbi:MAG: cyclopropane-fatty-acyl-phospholipid synthase family protein [Chloroflexota bacterium]